MMVGGVLAALLLLVTLRKVLGFLRLSFKFLVVIAIVAGLGIFFAMSQPDAETSPGEAPSYQTQRPTDSTLFSR